jgi:hypothetical protein
MPARVHHAVVALALLVGTTSCTGADADRPAGSTAHSITPLFERIAAPSVAPAQFEGEAVAVFGEALVDAGYAETAEFAALTTFDIVTLLPSPLRTEQQFLRHSDRMTARMAAEYRGVVERAFAGDAAAGDALYAARFFFNDDDEYQPRKGGPIVVDHVIEDPQVFVERGAGRDQLEVSFVQRADMLVQKNGAPAVWHLTKTATFWLDPGPPGDSRRWRIDGMDVAWSSDAPGQGTGPSGAASA